MRCVYIYIHTYSTCTLIVRVKDIDFRLCYLSCSNFDTHTHRDTHTHVLQLHSPSNTWQLYQNHSCILPIENLSDGAWTPAYKAQDPQALTSLCFTKLDLSSWAPTQIWSTASQEHPQPTQPTRPSRSFKGAISPSMSPSWTNQTRLKTSGTPHVINHRLRHMCHVYRWWCL